MNLTLFQFSSLQITQEATLCKNLSNVICARNVFLQILVQFFIKECILKEDFSNLTFYHTCTFVWFFFSVNKIFCQQSHLTYHRRAILEKNFSNATHAIKQSVGNLTYLHIKEFTPEENLSSVLRVRKHLIKNPTNLIIKKFMLENNVVLLKILVFNT